MPIVHRFCQCIRDAGAHSDHGGLFDAKLHGDSVGGLEANASNVARQAVRVFRHDLHGIRTVSLVDTDCSCRADPMAVQKDHDLAHDLLLSPGIGDAFGAHQANASHLAQPLRLGLDDIEYLLAKRIDHLFGVDRPDAADHSGTEIFLDAIDGRRRGCADEARFELLVMGVVIDPFAGYRNPLADRDDGSVTDDCDKIAMATGLCPQNTKAVIAIMKGDTLYKASQNFLAR